MPKSCSVDGCLKPHYGRGWCRTHYSRWYNNGSPMTVRKTPNGTTQDFVETALRYEGDDCLIWPYARFRNGYGQTRIGGKNTTAHRAICEKAYGPAPTPKHEAAHSCGRGGEGCVNPRHLRWATPIENNADKLIHDTHNRGERHRLAKLTSADVQLIRALRGKLSQRAIAEQFGIGQGHVSRVQRAKTHWAWL